MKKVNEILFIDCKRSKTLGEISYKSELMTTHEYCISATISDPEDHDVRVLNFNFTKENSSSKEFSLSFENSTPRERNFEKLRIFFKNEDSFFLQLCDRIYYKTKNFQYISGEKYILVHDFETQLSEIDRYRANMKLSESLKSISISRFSEESEMISYTIGSLNISVSIFSRPSSHIKSFLIATYMCYLQLELNKKKIDISVVIKRFDSFLEEFKTLFVKQEPELSNSNIDRICDIDLFIKSFNELIEKNLKTFKSKNSFFTF